MAWHSRTPPQPASADPMPQATAIPAYQPVNAVPRPPAILQSGAGQNSQPLPSQNVRPAQGIQQSALPRSQTPRQQHGPPRPLPVVAVDGIPATNPSPPQRLPNNAAPSNSNDARPIQRATFQAAPAAQGANPNQGPALGQVPPASMGDLPLPRQLQAPGTLTPPDPNAWTLAQSEAVALRFNPVLRHAIAQIDSARGDAQQASLYPNPRFDTNNPEVFAGQNSSYNAGFMQDIVVKGKLRLDRAAAEEVVRQRQHGLTINRFTLLLAVRQQFYSVLAAQRRLDLLVELRGIAVASVRAAEGRVQAAEASRSEVLLMQTELYRADIALRNAQTVLVAEQRQLSAIIGRPDLRIERVSGDLAFGFPDYDPENLRIFVVSQNSQVQVARREIDRQQILLRRARVEPYPNVRVGPTYNSNLTPTPGTSQFWFTVQFDIPTWNRNQGNIRSTQGDLADAIASLGVLQNGLLGQVEDVLGRYRAARQSEEADADPNVAQRPRSLDAGDQRIQKRRPRHFHVPASSADVVGNVHELLRSVGKRLDHGRGNRQSAAIGSFPVNRGTRFSGRSLP